MHHGPERRADDRIKEALPGTIRITGAHADPRLGEIPATVSDVGSGGAKIHSREMLARGWTVALRLELPEPAAETVEILATVAWSRRNALDLHGRCTSGLVFEPTHQPAADRLIGLFLARYLPPLAGVPPLARVEFTPPLP